MVFLKASILSSLYLCLRLFPISGHFSRNYTPRKGNIIILSQMKSQTNLLPPSLLLWQPGPRLLIPGRCRRGHQTISKHEVELFEAEKSRLLNLPLSGTIVRALISKPLWFMAFPVPGSGSRGSIRIIVSEEAAEVGCKGGCQTHLG